MHPSGARADALAGVKVQKVQRVQRVVAGALQKEGAPVSIKPLQPGFAREKTSQPRLWRVGNAPLSRLAGLPRERRQNKPQISNCFIIFSRHSAAKTSPSGESTAAGGDRGAFSTGEAWLACFPYRVLVRLYVFIIGALYDLKGACHLLRSGEKNRKLTPLSSVAYGATPFLGKGALYCGASRHHNPWARRRVKPKNLQNLLNPGRSAALSP